jgi:ribosomal protein S18 acetylase RimI-like enzyme
LLSRLSAEHREPLSRILRATGEFDPEEVDVALELIDVTLSREDTYRFWVDVEDGKVRGYVCYGPTPMTRGTYDLYWICVDPEMKGKGIGKKLIEKVEEELRAEGGRLVRVETAGLDRYVATRTFYDRIGYQEIARIRDFYWPGNDLVIYGRYL